MKNESFVCRWTRHITCAALDGTLWRVVYDKLGYIPDVTWVEAGQTGQADGTSLDCKAILKHNRGDLKYPKVGITVLKSVL